jgi:hypothetical protein
MLMPVDIGDWLPEDDLVSVVSDAVATVDLGGFLRACPPRRGSSAAASRRSAHRRIRDRGDAVLVHEPGQHPPHGMPLLARRLDVLAQHRVDQRLHRIQHRRRKRPRLAWWRHSRRQRLTHCPPMHSMPVRQRPDRQLLPAMITPDRLEQLHPRPHPPPVPGHQNRQGTRSRGGAK